LNLVNYPGLFLKERIAQVALKVQPEPSKVSWAIFHNPGAQAKNSNLTQMKYFCAAKIFWLGLGLSF
jgi:hypothetical protein